MESSHHFHHNHNDGTNNNNNYHCSNSNSHHPNAITADAGEETIQKSSSVTTIPLSIATLNSAADELVRQYHQVLLSTSSTTTTTVTATTTTSTNSDSDSTGHHSTATTTTSITLAFRNCLLTLLKLLNNIIKHSVPSASTTNQNNNNHNNDMYDKVRRILLYNKTIQQHVVNFPPSLSLSSSSLSSHPLLQPPPGVAFLYACGFVKATTLTTTANKISIGNATEMEQTLILLPHNESTSHLQKAIQLLVSICIYELHIPTHEIPTLPTTTTTAAMTNTTNTTTNPSSTVVSSFPGGFNPYQGYRMDLTGQNTNSNHTYSTSTLSKIDLELQQLQNAKHKLLLQQQQNHITRDHEWILTIVQPSGSNNSTSTSNTATTTSVTMSDGTLLAQRMQQQSMERMKRETSGFTTKAMREIEALKQARIYTHVTLGIQMTFSSYPNDNNSNSTNNNTMILQFHGKFTPNDTIDTVMTALLNDCFEPQLLETSTSSSSLSNDPIIDFELYSTPPMITYNDTKRYNTLQQEQLVPASKLFLRWIAPPSSLVPPKGNPQSKKRTTTTATATKTTVANPTTAILQPKWLSIIESIRHSNNRISSTNTTASTTISFPKSIPIRSALPTTADNDDDPDTKNAKKKSAVVPTPTTKKLTKEELMLRRMMGGK